VQFVYTKRGIQLPRTTAGLASAGKEVSLRKLQAADLLIFRGSDPRGPVGHVGIVFYADGEDTEFIHASTSKKGGGVIVSSLNQEYYKRRFIKAIVVIND
jgi:cell wall-associated NlpC family hydrolase